MVGWAWHSHRIEWHYSIFPLILRWIRRGSTSDRWFALFFDSINYWEFIQVSDKYLVKWHSALIELNLPQGVVAGVDILTWFRSYLPIQSIISDESVFTFSLSVIDYNHRFHWIRQTFRSSEILRHLISGSIAMLIGRVHKLTYQINSTSKLID